MRLRAARCLTRNSHNSTRAWPPRADPAGLAPLLDPLQLHTRDAILIPVNDKSDTSHVVGGSHWSLLIYTRQDDCFRHADSCDSLNLDAAARVAGKLSLFLRRPAGASSAPQPVACAQQENGYDCGPYLMHHAECFVRGVALDADADRAASMRGHVRGVIASLIAAQSSSASPAAAAAAGV